MLAAERAQEILSAMVACRVLVAGDLFLDEYLVGRAERLSREGPVPVLAFSRRFCVPGGAANPAMNVRAIGAACGQLGLIGDDQAGLELRSLLEAQGIDTSALLVDPNRPTTRKTRVVAEGLSVPQQVARIDQQDRSEADAEIEQAMIDSLSQAARDCEAIVLSHYLSGVVTEGLCRAAEALRDEHGLLLTADAQGDLERFRNLDLVRVGRADAAQNLGQPLDTEAAIERALSDLQARLSARYVILGRGSQGTSLIDECGRYHHLPPENRHEVYDVTGAGDTVIALTTLAVAAGADLLEAVSLANLAAAVVIRRLGVAAPTAGEIMAELRGGRA